MFPGKHFIKKTAYEMFFCEMLLSSTFEKTSVSPSYYFHFPKGNSFARFDLRVKVTG